MKTLTIASHQITLQPGQRYLASRPMASRKRKVFPVTIQQMDNGLTAQVIDGLDYDQANNLLNAFNNGVTSFEGRVW